MPRHNNNNAFLCSMPRDGNSEFAEERKKDWGDFQFDSFISIQPDRAYQLQVSGSTDLISVSYNQTRTVLSPKFHPRHTIHQTQSINPSRRREKEAFFTPQPCSRQRRRFGRRAVWWEECSTWLLSKTGIPACLTSDIHHDAAYLPAHLSEGGPAFGGLR